MTLEPVKATAEVGEHHELTDMTRRFWVGFALALPVFVLEMGSHIPALGMHGLISPQVSTWIQFALSTPVVLWAGWPFFQRAWGSIIHRSLNMFSLIALGTGSAYVYSLFASFAPDLFPADFRGMGGAVAVYFEAAAVITGRVLLRQVLELRAREQTGGAIRALLKLAPKTARRLKEDGQDEEVALELIQIGDRLRIRPGDGVPVDGEVLEGRGAVDESMVTGESMPAAKTSGDKLIGGTVNGTGSLIIRADKIGADTMLARIVAMVIPAAGLSEAEILPLAARLERSSEHPLAAAIVMAAEDRGMSTTEPTDFASITGLGVTGKIDGRPVALGNAKLMADLGIKFGELDRKADQLRSDGATALFLAIDHKPGGVIAIADPIKATTQAALDTLRKDGIQIVMLTGDNRTTAEAVARKLGIKEIEADVLPQDKHRIVKKLTSEGRIVAMAGDGVNDAPALAEASVGIAMGTGTEVAIQSAGITLVKGDLAGIARAIVLSRATMRNIRENLIFAFAYNAIGIPIAAGVLYPTFGILLSPIIGALAMSLSSVSVIANALRLRMLKL
jgi:cation transport ATPase